MKNKVKKTRVLLFIDRNTSVYFYSFGIEYIPQQASSKIRDKSITHNMFSIQPDNFIISGYILLLSQNICLQEKLCQIIPIIFSTNGYKKKEKRKDISTLKTNTTKENAGLEFRLKNR